MSSQDIKEDIKILDMKIQRTEQVIQEKKLKIERLQHKRSKLVSKLNSKSIGAEGLLERFTQTMAQAKEKSGHPSQDPSTSGEQMVPLKESSTQPIASSEDVIKTDEAYASSLLNKHYVIFNGPNVGCCREWSTVQPLVKGKVWCYQGFYNYELARKAFYDYCVKHNTPIQTVPKLVTPSDMLQPKLQKIPSFADKAKMPANPVAQPNKSFLRFNKIQTKDPDSHEFIPLETFVHYYMLAEVCNIGEGYFISNQKDFWYYNMTEGADPKLVQTLFYCGLLNMVYLGTNLKEISILPIGITTAVKHYRQKVLKEHERKVYFSFKSSFLDWEETEDETNSLKNYPAYHFIKLGLFQRQDVRPCTEVRSSFTPDLHTALAEFRAQTLGTLLRKTRTLYKDSNVRINYKSPHILLITESLHTISEQDCLKLQEFECQFYGNDLKISIFTKVKFCHYGSKDHKCDYCPEDNIEISTEDKTSSTKDRDSTAARRQRADQM
ncbi:hypothetical protein H0E87_004170 [Populus deltoides]|uniref:Uncharacterized protein n=1 Tax=Populus deltoides TaxID=3696 RepID=A0A8T2ZE49_POPDE|nr:hypothetical protein H0E87_004170 [Populus deltoides]